MSTIINIGSSANDGTGDPLRTAFDKINKNFQYVTPEQYGALGDGSADDSAAIASALATGYPVIFGAKNYRVDSTITLTDGMSVQGCGDDSIISTTSNIAIITIAGKGCRVSNMQLLGNSTGAAQRGVSVTGNAGLTLDYTSNRISNVTLRNLNHAGIYVTLVLGSSGSEHVGAIYAINCFAENCTNGYFLDTRGEYNSFAGCVAYNCTTGLRIVGGNNNFVGGSLVDGTDGVILATGTNDAHGIVASCKIHHNTRAVTATGITNGFHFIGNTMWGNGSVTMASCTGGIFFKSCELQSTIITSTNSISHFYNCRFVSTPTLTITGTLPKFFACTFDAGIANVVAGVTNTIEGGITYGTTASPASLSANTDNYAPTGGLSAAIIRVSASTPVNITGLSVGQASGREVILMNVDANTITLTDEDASSTAANRFQLTGNYSLLAEQAIKLVYDGTSSRWRKIY